jgi:hypothetical protein
MDVLRIGPRVGRSPMTYAAQTKVPISQSKADIERAVMRYGATAFVAGSSLLDGAMICFEMHDRRVMFRAAMPDNEQQARAKWRALLLCIKAKLESVESGIESFENAFMAHVVMPDGRTVGELVRPRIASAYSEGKMLPLLPGPERAP